MSKNDVKYELREDWLAHAVEMMRPEFEAAGAALPAKIRVACGFPSRGGLAKKTKKLGECWNSGSAADKVCQIYVSPLEDEPARAWSILRHELMHTVTKPGHGADFKKLGGKLGMEGPPKQMMAGDEVLAFFAEHQLPKLGWYNHMRLEPSDQKKKQSTRLLKVFCDGICERADGGLNMEQTHEEYVLRAARKQLDRGIPVCPLCNLEMQVED